MPNKYSSFLKDENIELLWVARYDYEKDWVLEKHYHNYYQIIYILDGDGSFFLEDNTYAISKDKLFLIKPEERHGLIADKEIAIKTLDIKFLINNSELKGALADVKNEIYIGEHKIRDFLEEIRQEGINKKAFYKDLGKIYLFQILLIILRECEESALKENLTDKLDKITDKNLSELCQSVLSYISLNYHKNIDLGDISKSTGYNKSYICQRFKEELQVTPIKYLYMYRIKKSKEFISYSDYSLKQIAAMTGFMNIHHFNRIFKEIENITPGQWRKIETDGIWKEVYLNDEFKNTTLIKTK